MKKTIMTMMAAAMIATTGTALAATPEQGNFQDSTSRVEMSYSHCGGYYGGGRGGYGCGGGYDGGYCWGNENQEG